MTSDTTLSQVCIYIYTYDLYFILRGRRGYQGMEYTILEIFFLCFWGRKRGVL